MSAHKRPEFKLGEYLLRGVEHKFKEGFDEVRFRDDVARANAVHARDRYDLFEDIAQEAQEDFARGYHANRTNPPSGGALRGYRRRKEGGNAQ